MIEWELDGQFKRCDICQDTIEWLEDIDDYEDNVMRLKNHLIELHRKSVTEKHTYGKCECGLIHG